MISIYYLKSAVYTTPHNCDCTFCPIHARTSPSTDSRAEIMPFCSWLYKHCSEWITDTCIYMHFLPVHWPFTRDAYIHCCMDVYWYTNFTKKQVLHTYVANIMWTVNEWGKIHCIIIIIIIIEHVWISSKSVHTTTSTPLAFNLCLVRGFPGSGMTSTTSNTKIWTQI